MKETSIRSLEKSDTKREPYAHEEILNIIRQDRRHCSPDGIHDLSEDPVAVKERDGGEGEWHAS
jgi:hypothetical protein